VVYLQANNKEERMFEIIMLFAFLFASISQLFPDRPAKSKKSRIKRKGHNKEKEKAGFLQQPSQKSLRASTLLKTKSLCCRYVRAA
jgi:hypothetical protein